MRQLAGTQAGRAYLRSEVEGELQAIFSRSQATAEAYGPHFSRLWNLASRRVRGGKFVRPLLLLETYDALRRSADSIPNSRSTSQPRGAHARSEVVRIAAAVEALHFAFLLHDDVIDGDFFRRGRPNLIGELAEASRDEARPGGARHWAQTGGILSGNLLLSCAHQVFARAKLPAELKLRLLDVLEHTVFETTAGEFIDVGLSDGVFSADLGTVLEMTGRKTASYTFELPLRAAVILADGSRALENKLSAAGLHLGLAYQLQDDLNSTFGDASVHGKDLYSDLREGKQTAIICFARMSGSWPLIESDFGNPDMSIEAAKYLSDCLRDCGAEDFVRGLIREQVEAFSLVLCAPDSEESVPRTVQDVLFGLLARIDGRQS
ncbi:polyprenyl synthetase family protein [Rarobacter faecitabidus]|uniref:Geranylgeranyl diphosphate synthase type II n=1 Tax=Rarobacter faecitabidus TaxID=13243 RepID=A0A542ZVC2_RARFA|nr:polyprenyl synthetase family protein [Rarobacter faecitabidus]TQL64307.1 geranylgeranyl diphosphate synthase type II [Rarobacter faecitabidus]